jgi:DNA primase
MTRSLDFGLVKEEANFEQILRHYELVIRGYGKQRVTLCPFHKDTKPSCSVHLERNVFNCFGCGAHGSVLDFVARIENASIREAAERIADICGLSHLPQAPRAKPAWTEKHDRDSAARPLRPMAYELTLDSSHPYLAQRGIGPELAATFGLGYCSRGWLKERICIPIHDELGALVAYAGRWANHELPQDIPKYVLSRGFPKRRVLFGLHRVAGAEHVVLVEGYWSVFRLYALNIPAIALMGRTLSSEQETLLTKSRVRMLTLLLDGDAPGRESTGELLPRLAKPFFVRVVSLPDGEEPDTVPEQFLTEVLYQPPLI